MHGSQNHSYIIIKPGVGTAIFMSLAIMNPLGDQMQLISFWHWGKICSLQLCLNSRAFAF